MGNKNKTKVIFIITLLLPLLFIPLVNADVIVGEENIPQIDQWNDFELPKGTYVNLTRIDGVWFANGTTLESLLNPNYAFAAVLIGLILVVLIIVPVIILIINKRR